MISNELREAANTLERLVSKESKVQVVDESFHAQIRAICNDLLGTAGVDGNGGCPLCQG